MSSTDSDAHRLVLHSVADVLAIVPYLIGFHPTDSIVVVALSGRRVVFAARGDLPPARSTAAQRRELAACFAGVVDRQDAAGIVLVGYGEADRVVPSVRAVGDALAATGLAILDEVRVAGDRYWCLLCDDPECCPPEGIGFDPVTSEVAAAATYAGQVALPDRAALARQVAPLEGPATESMRRATLLADGRLERLLAAADESDLLGAKALRIAGADAVHDAMESSRHGGRLNDDEIAWLGLLLGHLSVRDHAWRNLTTDDWQLSLWIDVVRRVQPDRVAPCASLLAFAAWRAGRGALAAVALDRALRAEPTYSMALLLDQAVRAGIPPSALDDRSRPGRAGRPRRRRPRPGGAGRKAVKR